jgi:hypothetical protein
LFSRFDSSSQGTVWVKRTNGEAETSFPMLLPGQSFPVGRPHVIPPPGLPLQRQQYLFKHIREFVDDPYKDIVCPQPEEMSAVDEGLARQPEIVQDTAGTAIPIPATTPETIQISTPGPRQASTSGRVARGGVRGRNRGKAAGRGKKPDRATSERSRSPH